MTIFIAGGMIGAAYGITATKPRPTPEPPREPLTRAELRQDARAVLAMVFAALATTAFLLSGTWVPACNTGGVPMHTCAAAYWSAVVNGAHR